MKTFEVHIFETVRVHIKNIQAGTMKEAISQAEKIRTPLNLFPTTHTSIRSQDDVVTEHADETTGYLVDELDQKGDLKRSIHFNVNGQPN